jgi:hypothetical protein
MQSAEINQLEQKALVYRQMLDECIDAIGQLSKYEPEGFEIAFKIKGSTVYSMALPPSEKEFSLSFFISWRLFYYRQLEDITATILTLKSNIAV